MEMQRHLMLMYTSCGWFFDELSGIETVQVIQYAGRAVQLASEVFDIDMEEEFRKRLAAARGNLRQMPDGASVYDKYVKPAAVNLEKLAAHYAISSLIEDYGDTSEVYRYVVTRLDYRKVQAGTSRLVIGQLEVTSLITRDSGTAGFAVLHLGGHVINGGVRVSPGAEGYEAMKKELVTVLREGSLFRHHTAD